MLVEESDVLGSIDPCLGVFVDINPGMNRTGPTRDEYYEIEPFPLFSTYGSLEALEALSKLSPIQTHTHTQTHIHTHIAVVMDGDCSSQASR